MPNFCFTTFTRVERLSRRVARRPKNLSHGHRIERWLSPECVDRWNRPVHALQATIACTSMPLDSPYSAGPD